MIIVMLILDCAQGSVEWFEARLGIPTASEFSRIVTPGGKLSASRDAYMAELLAEYALGYAVTDFDGNMWTERGKALEDDALRFYSFITDQEVEKVGFVYAGQHVSMVGCSPDFMSNGAPGELKCPSAPVHLLWLIRGVLPREHRCQVQGQIWVTGSSHCDFLSYYPELPPLYIRVEPDLNYQAALTKHLPTFIEELIDGREKLRDMGILTDE